MPEDRQVAPEEARPPAPDAASEERATPVPEEATPEAPAGGRRPEAGRDGTEAGGGDGPSPPRYEHLRTLFEHAFEFIGLFSPEGRLLEVNPSALRFAGLERSEVIGRLAWETPWLPEDPEARGRLRRAVREAAGGDFVRYTTRLRGSGGREATIDFSLTPVRDGDGEVTFIVSEGRNITARKEAEQALRVSRARLSAILRSALDAIVAVDEEGRIRLFNEGAERIFGYDREEVLGGPLSVLIPEGLRGVHRDHLREFARSPVQARPMSDRAGVVGRRKGGEEFPAEASIAKVEVGGSRLYTAVLRDVTERREAERERERLLARERQARWRAERAERRTHFLSEASMSLSRTLDVDATLQALAELAVPELGDICVVDVTEEERIRRVAVADPAAARGEAAEVLPADRRPRPDGPVGHVLRTGEPLLVPRLGPEEIAEMAAGPEEEVGLEARGARSLIVVPLIARGTTLGAVCLLTAESGRELGERELTLARDLSIRAALALDNARLYAEARNATKARDEMLRVVSHDLRNPITGVLMGARMLERQLGADDDALGELVEGVHESAVRLHRLVRDLADVASAERGGLSIERAPQRVEPLVKEAVRANRAVAEEREIELRVRTDEDLPPVSVDRNRTLQVLSNLLDNALRFTPEGGRVEVRAVSDAGKVVVSVSDTGPGVPPEDREQVFERFWRGPGPSGEGKAGTGLGLAIAKGIVEGHGERIWVESSPGEGSTFSFTLSPAEGPEPG